MSNIARLVTAGELEKFRDNDSRYELVEGRIIRMTPVGYQHGKVVVKFASRLHQFVHDQDLGVVLTEVGFKLASNPDTVRGPDIAFIRHDRLPPLEPRRFFTGPPDLVVEVLSPDDTAADVAAKVEEYLEHGVSVVVIVDLDQRSISVHRRLTPTITAKANDDVIELGDVVSGFRCALREILD